MKTEKQDEALARIDARQALTSDGLTPLKIEQIIMDGAHIYRLLRFGTNAGKSEVIPDYNDRNNLHRLVEGLSEEEGVDESGHSDRQKFNIHLVKILTGYGVGQQYWDESTIGLLFLATPAQIKEALLKAVNLWEVEGGD